MTILSARPPTTVSCPVANQRREPAGLMHRVNARIRNRRVFSFFRKILFLADIFLYFFHNLGQSMRTSMQSLESVAELLHNYIIFGGHFAIGGHFVFDFFHNQQI